MASRFDVLAKWTARTTGHPVTFAIAGGVVLIWLVTGPLFDFSNTWQLVINTGTTIVTFLMVFLIQATQNRDSREIHLKLDELLRAISKARTGIADLEDLSDDELDSLLHDFHRARKKKGMPRLVEQAEVEESEAEEADEEEAGSEQE